MSSQQRSELGKEVVLALADGTRWAIGPGDEESAPFVAQLGATMRLRAEDGVARHLRVVMGRGTRPRGAIHFPADGRSPVLFELGAAAETGYYFGEFQRITFAVTRRALAHGGILLHGALVERHGKGVILGGPGGVGKTTACERLCPPWCSLFDDTTLVVRDVQGVYRAHPWPTWSRLLPDGPGGSWDVQRSVPLDAVFFLTQKPENRAEPVGRALAAASLVELSEQVSRIGMRDLDEGEARKVRLRRFDNACELAKVVPMGLLHVSLTGPFWEEIERVLCGVHR